MCFEGARVLEACYFLLYLYGYCSCLLRVFRLVKCMIHVVSSVEVFSVTMKYMRLLVFGLGFARSCVLLNGAFLFE